MLPPRTSRSPLGEERGFRHAMAGLHTWGGLLAAWLLFVIFLTGTLGVFDQPITRWMKPEPPPRDGPTSEVLARPDLIRLGQRHLQQVAPHSHFWSLGLPSAADPALRLFWEDQQARFQSARLNPRTGEPLAPGEWRDTQGGHHFVHMHFEFQAGTAGIWLVGLITMAMLVALVSGIITHRRIFKDFFTFRPGKGQRSWLDAHNAAAVLTLPFQFMIAYTGLAIFYSLYMPAGIQAHYPTRDDFFQELTLSPPHRDETGIPAPVAPLADLLTQAEEILGRPASFVVVEHPGDSSASVRVFGRFNEQEARGRLYFPGSGVVQFDGVGGEVQDARLPLEARGGAALVTQRAMSTLHFASFGGTTVRWLYFALGLAGTAMMATGAVLFMVKRRRKSLREFGRHTARVYRLIDVLNVAVIAGLSVACIGYLWINRLLPAAMPERAAWEIRLFFLVWAAMVLHAAVRPVARAWAEQLGLCAMLLLGLPLINAASTGQHLLFYWRVGDGERLGVELTAVALGGLCLWAWRQARARAVAGAAAPTRLGVEESR